MLSQLVCSFSTTAKLLVAANDITFVFHCVSVTVCSTDVLIYSAAQLHECLINLLTYLLIYYVCCHLL